VTVQRVTASVAAGWLKPRPRGANKGDAGRVLIIAGSRGMSGAAVLSALGAARGGSGLVRVATVKSQQPVVAKRAPLEATSAVLPEDASGRLSMKAVAAVGKIVAAFRPDVIALGPGLGATPATRALVKQLAYRGDVPLVIDADGLNVLSQLKGRVRAPAALTPHPGEMARLLGVRHVPADRAGRVRAARAAAAKYGAAVLLKGAATVVTDGRAVWQNTTGNPAMASGGMGDVLTGLAAATWAQADGDPRATAGKALAFAAFVHGRAADVAVKDFPERTLLASDLAAALPAAFKTLWRRKRKGGR